MSETIDKNATLIGMACLIGSMVLFLVGLGIGFANFQSDVPLRFWVVMALSLGLFVGWVVILVKNTMDDSPKEAISTEAETRK
jgi:hypothetical protein